MLCCPRPRNAEWAGLPQIHVHYSILVPLAVVDPARGALRLRLAAVRGGVRRIQSQRQLVSDQQSS